MVPKVGDLCRAKSNFPIFKTVIGEGESILSPDTIDIGDIILVLEVKHNVTGKYGNKLNIAKIASSTKDVSGWIILGTVDTNTKRLELIV